MAVADNFAFSTLYNIFKKIMRSNVEALNNQSYMTDMKQEDLHQQALTIIFMQGPAHSTTP